MSHIPLSTIVLITLIASVSASVPQWTPTYSMPLSTIVMPCNYSGWFDTNMTAQFGVVDFDWSNAKQMWANQQPMDCEERLMTQAAMVKAVNPQAKVWVYRNLVKALPWFSSVRTKITDPAYSGWFLKFKPNGPYHVPNCDKNYNPPLCSDLYHDQDQTPQHPSGDGSCTKPCDCGGVPCGEYLWDHRNDSLREFLINEFLLGPTGLGDPNVSGFYLDDGWANTSQPVAPWEPQPMGFCDHSPIGGATEEDYRCTEDMGLTQADTTAITDGWQRTMQAVQKAVINAGGFAWQFTTSFVGAPTKVTCASWFRGPGKSYASQATIMQFTNATQRPLPAVNEDLATFLLVRGPYAWLGYGWVGCITDYEFPSQLSQDFGKPTESSYSEVGTSGVFTRKWSKATVSFDCNAWKGSVQTH